MKFVLALFLVIASCSTPVETLPETPISGNTAPADPAFPVQGAGTGEIYWLSPEGNDTTGNGSMENPWRTINRVSNGETVPPGSVINLRGGVYALSGQAWFGDSGTDSAWITIQSAPGERAVLDGILLPEGKSVFSVGGSYIHIKNMTMQNSPKSGFSIWGGSHVVAESLAVFGCQSSGIYTGYRDTGVVQHVQIRSCTVSGNCLSNSARPDFGSGWPGAVLVQQSKQVTVWNCRVFENLGEGIIFGGSRDGLCQDNRLYDNFSIHIYLDNSAGMLVQNNFCYTTNNPGFFRFGQAANSLQMNNEKVGTFIESRNNTLRNNLCIGGRSGFTYWKDQPGGLQSCKIYNNSFIGITETGINIYADNHRETEIYNNLVLVASGAKSTKVPDLTGLSFHHNGWADSAGCDAYGSVIGSLPAVSDSSNPHLWNLPAGSPFVRAGSIAGYGWDFFRSPRPEGASDLGAVLYSLQ